MLQVWKGFRGRRYGPKAAWRIPRMSDLYWHISGRAYWKSYERPWKNVPGINKQRLDMIRTMFPE